MKKEGTMPTNFSLTRQPKAKTANETTEYVHPPQYRPPSAVLSTLRSAATEDGLRRTGYGGRATEDGRDTRKEQYRPIPFPRIQCIPWFCSAC